jgi:hypothetical protein
MADAVDAAQLLGVDVHQFAAGSAALIAYHRQRCIERLQASKAVGQHTSGIRCSSQFLY